MRPPDRVRRSQCEAGFDRYVCRVDVAISDTLENTRFFCFVTSIVSEMRTERKKRKNK
jgi:hypothetical protein